MPKNKTKHVLVYPYIHKELRKIAFEKETSITKIASNLLIEILELEDKGGNNGK